jgi:integrase
MVKTKPESLSFEEVCAIMQAASGQPRQYLMLRIMIKTGLRLAELGGIERSDIKEYQEKDENGIVKGARYIIHISRDTAKRGEEREVVLDAATSTTLKQYLNLYKKELDKLEKQVNKWNQEHKQEIDAKAIKRKRASIWFNLTPVAIQNMVKKYARLAGVSKNVSPHTFRHFFCEHLIRNGMPPHQVQKMMGHKSLNTTLTVYAKVLTVDCIPSWDKIMSGW